VPNFFATFIEVRKDRDGAPFEVEPGVTAGDYLQGFLRGTRSSFIIMALSITISVPHLMLSSRLFSYERSRFLLSFQYQRSITAGLEAGKKARRILAFRERSALLWAQSC